MARPLRVEFSGAYYHMMNRGNLGQEIFSTKDDGELFLDALENACDAFRVKIVSYCLMVNHFHLYLRTEEANLSKFAQSLLTSFTIRKNRRDRRSGHLFQGRYKAILVENESYGADVDRYIHLNPIRVKSLHGMPLTEKRALLRNFAWSSYPITLGSRKKPSWLDVDESLRRWGKSRDEQRGRYAEFVETGLIEDIANPFERAAAGAVLGAKSFIDRIRGTLPNVAEKMEARRELAQTRRFIRWVDFNTLLDAVAEETAIHKSRLLKPYASTKKVRRVLIYLSSCLCRGRYTATELAAKLGLTLGGFTSGAYKAKMEFAENRDFLTLARKIQASVGGENVK